MNNSRSIHMNDANKPIVSTPTRQPTQPTKKREPRGGRGGGGRERERERVRERER